MTSNGTPAEIGHVRNERARRAVPRPPGSPRHVSGWRRTEWPYGTASEAEVARPAAAPADRGRATPPRRPLASSGATHLQCLMPTSRTPRRPAASSPRTRPPAAPARPGSTQIRTPLVVGAGARPSGHRNAPNGRRFVLGDCTGARVAAPVAPDTVPSTNPVRRWG